MKVRTRFAPSPTGFMHIGGVRTALFAYVIAKQNEGNFILRIEDTDQQRYVEGAVEVIYKTLKDLELNWDEGPDIGGEFGPYVQSERKANYLKYAEKLVEENKAYYCFCNEERLVDLKKDCELRKVPYKYDRHCRSLSLEDAKKRISNNEKYVIRFKMPMDGNISFEDMVYGNIVVNNNELEDLILIKSDLMPTYNFANIIDDHEMNITHIVRGNEYVSSTPKYVLIYKTLNWDVPNFIHLPVIKKNTYSDKKLSKRDSDATIEDLKSKGYLNKSIINMLALTGFSPLDNVELFSLQELIEKFDIKRINKVNAIFDVDKLNYINSCYIKELNEDEYLKFIMPFFKNDKSYEWLKEIALLYKNSLSYGSQILEFSSMFFEEKVNLDSECIEFLNQENVDLVLNTFKSEISLINDWTIENINNAINNVKEKTNIKGKMLFMPIRIKVSGYMHGPELPNTIHLIGKEKVLNRL